MPRVPRKPKNGWPALNFYGFAGGTWYETDEYIIEKTSGGQNLYDWSMISGLSSANNGNIYHVEHATESHSGFRQALQEIVDQYPELSDYWIEFDGPRFPIHEILTLQDTNWSEIEFLHGTSTALQTQILTQGLLSRSQTGMPPTYGRTSNALPGRVDAIYLTTQRNMANFAARDATNLHGGKPLILKVKGLSRDYVIPDIDSRVNTAEESLHQLGAIGYIAPISPSMISQSRRSNPDSKLRQVERIYQAAATLDNLVRLNVELNRVGELLQPFFEEALEFLHNQTNYLGIKVPLPKKHRVEHLRVLSSGRRNTDDGYFVDRTVFEVSPLKSLHSPFLGNSTYRLVIRYQSKDETLSVKLKSPVILESIHRHTFARLFPAIRNIAVRFIISKDAHTQITYYNPYRQPHDGNFFEQEALILDPRTLPELLFLHMKMAIDKQREVLAQDLRNTATKHDIVRELLTYIRYVNHLDGSIKEDPLITFALGRADLRGSIENFVKRELVDRLNIPESGIPTFSKVEMEIAPSWSRKISSFNKGYYLTLNLHYNDMVEEDEHNLALAERESEETQTYYFETPAQTSRIIQSHLQNLLLSNPGKQKWKCEPEVVDFDGMAIDVIIHCQIKLDIDLFFWLMTWLD